MNHDALSIVTRALRDRIDAALHARASSRSADAVHIGPLNDTAAKDARLVLCLYRVSVNAELRNAEHRIVPTLSNLPIATYENSLPLDLHYLLSTSSPSTNGLQDLGIAMQALNDRPYLAGAALQSDIVHLSFQAMTTEEIGRVWALFPNVNYRMSVLILATPVWIDHTPLTDPAGPVVKERYGFAPVVEEQP
ncbi:hypothetical protein GCM10027431_26570 [Lysobacter rhizosphaerae]